MNIKNYTSTVPASGSMANIEKCLVKAGAQQMQKTYEEGICTSITFTILIGIRPVVFLLPAKVNACFDVLWGEIVRPHSGTRQKVKEQAERTAWKIISDWVEIQLTMIELDQAEVIEIFLPYVYNPESKQTFFESLKSSNFKALTNG